MILTLFLLLTAVAVGLAFGALIDKYINPNPSLLGDIWEQKTHEEY